MTVEMIDKWVTSLRFNEIMLLLFCFLFFNYVVFYVWSDSSAVAIFDCSLNVYACGWQKALSMPAYCVAANCNNSQATQSLTTHEFPRNRPAVRRKWVKFVQFKRADLEAAPHCHAHLCSEHFPECDFVNFTAEYQMGFASRRNL